MDLEELKQNGSEDGAIASSSEIWINVTNHYMVSNLGRVKSLDRMIPIKRGKDKYYLKSKGKVLNPVTHSNGYKVVCIDKKILLVHRLVANAFLPNPDSKPQVNHKNGLRGDNRLINLEWSTVSENLKHSFAFLGRKPSTNGLGKTGKLSIFSTPIKQLDKDMNFIKLWDSMADIRRELGFNQSLIHRCCNRKELNAYGYKWAYAD